MTSASLGIIADDLTGSLDTGVQFSKWGLSSLVGLRDFPLPDVACMIVNTDSRSVPPSVAEREAGLAAGRLRGRLVYKKIDSTLRGNLGSEIVAVLDALALEKAVVAPAFPANGRTVLGGRLYVNGVPLEQTGFARDPRNAVDESHIPALLRRQTGWAVGLVELDAVERGADAVRQAIARRDERIVVVDSETQEHLANVARAAVQPDAAWLPVGSAGLAEALPTAIGLPRPGHSRSGLPGAKGSVLCVAGSRNEVTVDQVRAVAKRLDLPLIEPDLRCLLESGNSLDEVARVVGEARRCLTARNAAVLTTCFAPLVEGGSQDIAAIMGSLTLRIMEDGPVGALFLTGGDVALQACLALDGQALQPVAEVLPGLPLSLLYGGRWDGLRIVTKAGGFGEPDALIFGFHYLSGEGENEA